MSMSCARSGRKNSMWLEGSAIGVPAGNAKRPIGIFVRYDASFTIPNVPLPPDTWHTIDLNNGPQWVVNNDPDTFQPNLPNDVKAVFLSGLLIISHPGYPTGTVDLWANFRAPGDTLDAGSYQIQTIQAGPAADQPVPGVRSNCAVWVPVKDKKFEFYWHYSPPGAPAMMNLSLQAYVH